ncbi:HNH/ENDO VII family nuclease [Parapedobacter sp. DT-150]|uniref:HNH/ENDO VII family nuclease n=1 Tax=Parapedobacter sp. DT-150 TaxID=3396162 RepID=UPI003F1C4ADB
MDDENKIDRDLLDAPTKPGNAPTFKKDGTSVEIHHDGQKAQGPFKEMHRDDHRTGENYKKNHPDEQKPLTKEERKDFDKARREYWKKEYPKNQ